MDYKDFMNVFAMRGGDRAPEPQTNSSMANKINQFHMSQVGSGPVKQQNKQMKNNAIMSIGEANPERISTVVKKDGSFYQPTEMQIGRSMTQEGYPYTELENINPNRVVTKFSNGSASPIKDRYLANNKVNNGLVNRLAGPIGALPMIAPEALGMVGAAQEAQQRGVNPTVNWMQRMIPMPVVAPTGNGGEVYNYQSGERYTLMY